MFTQARIRSIHMQRNHPLLIKIWTRIWEIGWSNSRTSVLGHAAWEDLVSLLSWIPIFTTRFRTSMIIRNACVIILVPFLLRDLVPDHIQLRVYSPLASPVWSYKWERISSFFCLLFTVQWIEYLASLRCPFLACGVIVRVKDSYLLLFYGLCCVHLYQKKAACNSRSFCTQPILVLVRGNYLPTSSRKFKCLVLQIHTCWLESESLQTRNKRQISIRQQLT